MKVCCITATKDRHQHLERVVRFVLNQTYKDYIHLIFNNSPTPQRLNENLPKDKFLLINKSLSNRTKKPYETLGDIYMDAMEFVPVDAEVVTFMDDDDIYLPNHLEEGVKGLQRGGKTGYKPQRSWFKQAGRKMVLAENVLEPSIFVKKEHILKYGFGIETSAQHIKWVEGLKGDCFVDPNGPPTYICDWSQELKTFKTSGDPNNPNNFNNYVQHTKDAGDLIITPCSQALAEQYYKIR